MARRIVASVSALGEHLNLTIRTNPKTRGLLTSDCTRRLFIVLAVILIPPGRLIVLVSTSAASSDLYSDGQRSCEILQRVSVSYDLHVQWSGRRARSRLDFDAGFMDTRQPPTQVPQQGANATSLPGDQSERMGIQVEQPSEPRDCYPACPTPAQGGLAPIAARP